MHYQMRACKIVTGDANQAHIMHCTTNTSNLTAVIFEDTTRAFAYSSYLNFVCIRLCCNYL